MTLFANWAAGLNEKNTETLAACLHDDFEFVRHQTGTTMNKAEMIEMFKGFFSSDAIETKEHNCLYENDEVLVEHSVIDFPDGSTESIVTFHRLEDGKIRHTQTGATPIKKES